jgi:hypothetical protein
VLITTFAFQLIIRIAIAVPLDLSTPEYHRSEDRVCIQKGEYPCRTTAAVYQKREANSNPYSLRDINKYY